MGREATRPGPVGFGTRACTAAFVLGVLAAVGSGAAKAGEGGSQAPAERPDKGAFVGSGACAECHRAAYDLWTGSHHQRAMQRASETTVLGNFNGAGFTHYDITTRFFKRDGKFFVNTEGPDGKPADFEVRYTFGLKPLQQYLVEFPGGRLQSLAIAWDTENRRWFSLYPNEHFRPDDPLHWTGRYQNWNLMCAECHTTDLAKGYDPATDSYRTTWVEMDVGCEACHGPGKKHVQWARALKPGDPAGPDHGLAVDFKGHDNRYQVDVCAACHARRGRITAEPLTGQPFLDRFMPELLRAGMYHADGQILEEVYEYGSFLQSKMYRQGVRCSDCHEPHGLKLRAEGNALCTRCHGERPDPRFPTLKPKRYDAPEHHFHPAGSTGARCIECHMPAKRYMVVDPRRDHSLRVPRPDLSVKLGTPNACTACHADKDAQWAMAKVAQWYGPGRGREPHYAEVLAAGRKADARARLAALATDRGQPGIARASALDLLRGYEGVDPNTLVAATRDDDPLVRLAAAGALEALPEAARIKAALPLLTDPLRAVRIEAARALASAPAGALSADDRRIFEAALAEYRDAQIAVADMPQAHLNLAVLYARQGQTEEAERAYRKALSLDPYLVPAYANLAQLYNARGRNAEAEKALREGIAHVPAGQSALGGELYYSLGLLLAEEKRLEEAVQALAAASERLPERARVQYNYGLALQQLGRRREAEAALFKAALIAPQDPEIIYALCIFYVQERRWREALPYAQRLASLAPQAALPQQLARDVEQALSVTGEQ